MLLPVCLRFYFSGACAVLSKQLIDLFLTSNDWFFHDIILYHVAPEVITKPKTVGFWRLLRRWEPFIWLFVCVHLIVEAKKLTKLEPPSPQKRNQLHYGWTSGVLFCFGLVTVGYLYFTRFTLYYIFLSLFLLALFLKRHLHILSFYHRTVIIYISSAAKLSPR